jgi:excinuclease ABC subunit B
LRLSATHALLERRDTVVVSSVSCIYGLGDPDIYRDMYVAFQKGAVAPRDPLLRKLVEMQYVRAHLDFVRGQFRVRGDRVEIFPAYGETIFAVDFFGDEVERIQELDALTMKPIRTMDQAAVYPAKIYVMPQSETARAVSSIQAELKERLEEFKAGGRLLEAQRLDQRTRFDLEMLKETGSCAGIENYSRHLDGREAGTPPKTLLDYLPKGSLVIIDESHVTVPQVRGMYEGDRSRKLNLVEHGFRLPSALDNRPLYFEEFEQRCPQCVHVSATPGEWEMKKAQGAVAEQIIRPTGLVDPEIEVRPAASQVDDLLGEVRARAAKGERVLVTTLTKRMAEELTRYFSDQGVRVRYLHSDIDALERVKILRSLRLGEFDCLVGINLLREGLDLPEVSLVAILDADKEGFLRSDRSLIQTMGRAARNVEGRAILYAASVTASMRRAMDETLRRRERQLEYNREHGITPQTVRSSIKDVLESVYEADYYTIDVPKASDGAGADFVDPESIPKLIVRLEKDMREAAAALEFERAAEIRDQVQRLRNLKPGELIDAKDLRIDGGKGPERVVRRGSGGRRRSPRPKPGA